MTQAFDPATELNRPPRTLAPPELWVVATDLDGTLLDETYPIDAAMAVLKRLSERLAIHFVLASSKTLPEMQAIAERCELNVSIVFENGGGFALLGPEGWKRQTIGCEYPVLRTHLATLRELGFAFRGFGDMTEQEISRRTGLSLEQASLAKDRSVTEPIVWTDSEDRLKEFTRHLAEKGLQISPGGRFLHVSSAFDKSSAVSQIATELSAQASVRVLACGDAPNDLAMLNAADHAVIFPRRESGYMKTRHERFTHARRPGPAGWLIGVTEALQSRGAFP